MSTCYETFNCGLGSVREPNSQRFGLLEGTVDGAEQKPWVDQSTDETWKLLKWDSPPNRRDEGDGYPMSLNMPSNYILEMEAFLMSQD